MFGIKCVQQKNSMEHKIMLMESMMRNFVQEGLVLCNTIFLRRREIEKQNKIQNGLLMVGLKWV